MNSSCLGPSAPRLFLASANGTRLFLIFFAAKGGREGKEGRGLIYVAWKKGGGGGQKKTTRRRESPPPLSPLFLQLNLMDRGVWSPFCVEKKPCCSLRYLLPTSLAAPPPPPPPPRLVTCCEFPFPSGISNFLLRSSFVPFPCFSDPFARVYPNSRKQKFAFEGTEERVLVFLLFFSCGK